MLTVTPPTDLPVTLDYVKAHSSVDFSDDDALINAYILAATGYLDGPSGIMGRAVLSQAATETFSCLGTFMSLSYGSVSSLGTVQYYDEDNALQTLAGGMLVDDVEGPFIWFDPTTVTLPATYARPDAVIVTYTAGWANAAAVPEPIKLAIAMMCTTWFCQREDFVDSDNLSRVPLGVKEMVSPWRKVPV